MGWKSTLSITRADAINAIVGKILSADDGTLADILDDLFSESMYNFRIVGEYEDDPEAWTFRNRPNALH